MNIPCPIVRLEFIEPHPDADKLELLLLSNGVTVVAGKHYRPDILGVYIPPGMLLPGWLAEDLWLFGRATAMTQWFQVREIMLRGQRSPGLFCGSIYKKVRDDARSVARFDKIVEEGGGASRWGEDWIRWSMWRQGWREGDDVSIYLGIVPAEKDKEQTDEGRPVRALVQ